jgi:hypothetical protein
MCSILNCVTLCAFNYRYVWKYLLFIGEILDLERSETIPLIEKETQEHEVTIEN